MQFFKSNDAITGSAVTLFSGLGINATYAEVGVSIDTSATAAIVPSNAVYAGIKISHPGTATTDIDFDDIRIVRQQSSNEIYNGTTSLTTYQTGLTRDVTTAGGYVVTNGPFTVREGGGNMTKGLGVTPGAGYFSNDVVAFATSDKRLKENIIPISNPLNALMQLAGVEFDWKDGLEHIQP